MDKVEEAPSLSKNNRDAVLSAKACGCYFCLRVFPSSDVDEFFDEGKTAVCPYCGIDSVIPADNSSCSELVSFHERWFCGSGSENG